MRAALKFDSFIICCSAEVMTYVVTISLELYAESSCKKVHSQKTFFVKPKTITKRNQDTTFSGFTKSIFAYHSRQKVRSSEQKLTSNEQKLTRTKQPTTTEQQKVMTNEQNVTSNEQRAKSSASPCINFIVNPLMPDVH